jgi:hypothetical protein
MKFDADDFKEAMAAAATGALDGTPLYYDAIAVAALRIAARVAEVFGSEVIDGVNVSHDPVLNLAGALIDLEREPRTVKVCLRTIKRVQDQLVTIRKALTDPPEEAGQGNE